MSSSQIFTIGTALRRAEDNNVPVEVLVEGQWLRGNVAAMDGDGLVLVTPERTQCVVRNAHISVVRLLADLSFHDEDASGPAETSYDAPQNAADPTSSTFSWASPDGTDPRDARIPAASAGDGYSGTYSASDDADHAYSSTDYSALIDEDRLVLDGTPDEILVLGSGSDDTLTLGPGSADDAFVLEAGVDEGPLELGSGSWVADELHPDEVDAEELDAEASHTDESTEPAPAKEEPADLVSRLLAESMREAGIEPESASDTPAEAANDNVVLLHPDKVPAPDDEPRLFALPAASSAAASTEVAAVEPAAEPAPAAVAPTPEPAPAPAPAAAAPAGDDWRSMLEGLRGEASAVPSPEQPQDKRRGRRLVMR